MQLYLGAKWRWYVGATPRPLYPRQSSDRLARNVWLYRLSYPGASSYVHFLSPPSTNADTAFHSAKFLVRQTCWSNYNTPRDVRVMPTRVASKWKNGWRWLKGQKNLARMNKTNCRMGGGVCVERKTTSQKKTPPRKCQQTFKKNSQIINLSVNNKNGGFPIPSAITRHPPMPLHHPPFKT